MGGQSHVWMMGRSHAPNQCGLRGQSEQGVPVDWLGVCCLMWSAKEIGVACCVRERVQLATFGSSTTKHSGVM